MASVQNGGETIRQAVVLSVGDEEVEKALYREEHGTLADSKTVWREFTTVSELPDRPLFGWEELVVFTPDYVYQWVETGYGSNPTILPRDPDMVVSETDVGEGV